MAEENAFVEGFASVDVDEVNQQGESLEQEQEQNVAQNLQTIRERSSKLPPATDEPNFYNDYLDNLLVSELGLEDGTIITGSEDNPLEYNVNELPFKQKVALLKHHYEQAKGEELEPSEKYLLDKLRSNDPESIRQVVEKLSFQFGFNAPVQQPQITEQQIIELDRDEVYRWKIRSEYPEFSDEEVEQELQNSKEGVNYETKAETARRELITAVNEQQKEQARQSEPTFDVEAFREEISEISKGISNIADFETDEQTRERVLRKLTTTNKEGKIEFLEALNTHEGLYETALLWEILPEISGMVEKLQDENSQLKKRLNSPKLKTDYQRSDGRRSPRKPIMELDPGQKELFARLPKI